MLDEDALIAELRQLREERDALRIGIQAIHDETVHVRNHWARREIRERLSALLDTTSITGE